MTDIGEVYLTDVRERFRKLKETAERAISQVGDHDLLAVAGVEVNSIAVTMKHMAGNLRSRFTDFLTTDGEKPDRNRDGEFEIAAGEGRRELMAWWSAGWEMLFNTLEGLAPADLIQTITIRGEPHTVIGALNRQLAHQAYHVGQVVMLAKYHAGEEWHSLTIPRRGERSGGA